MNPPKCRTCGVSEFGHVCSGRLRRPRGPVGVPAPQPKVLSGGGVEAPAPRPGKRQPRGYTGVGKVLA
jgi:hypothetical protein